MWTRIEKSWNKETIWQHQKKEKENADNVLNLEVVQVVLVQFNLVDNKYQQKSEALYTFTPNKYYAYLLNAEPSNLLFLKTCNIEFYEILIAFTDLNDRPLEIGNKVSLKLVWDLLLTNRNDVKFYRTMKKKIS